MNKESNLTYNDGTKNKELKEVLRRFQLTLKKAGMKNGKPQIFTDSGLNPSPELTKNK